MSKKFRSEKDSLGEHPVPFDAWYGIQTARAVENFPISGRRPDRDFIVAHVRIKRAAAVVNESAGVLEPRLAWAIIEAADVFRAKIIDLSKDSLIIELTGEVQKLNAFIEIMQTYGVLELARTGITALARGKKN